MGYPKLAQKCLDNAGDCARVKANWEIMVKHFDKDKLKSILDEIRDEMLKLKSLGTTQEEVDETDEDVVPPLPTIAKSHPQLPALSNKLEVRYEPGRGRHVVAREKIEIGIELLVDK